MSTIEEVQQRLDIRRVAALYGADFEGGDVVKCLLHADDSPSMSFFQGDDGRWRFHCHGCSAQGDVIDLVRRFEDLDSFSAAFERCLELLGEDLPEVQQAALATPEVDRIASWQQVLDSADRADQHALNQLLADKELRMPADWLRAEFGVRADSDERILIPIFADTEVLLGVKWRKQGQKAAMKGSRLSEFYGAHRDRGNQRVLLFEGETDTWTGAWALRDQQADVLGVPAGAGARPKPDLVARLEGRDVTLVLDADTAGRASARRWADALAGKAKSVRIALLPETCDASAVSEDTLLHAISAARRAPEFSRLSCFRSGQGRFMLRRPTEKEPDRAVSITEWTFEVLDRMEIPEVSIHYSVRLPDLREVRLGHSDLRNPDTFSRWANRYGLTHQASGNATQALLELLEAESVYRPRLTGSNLLGLHGDSFLLPDRTLGRKDRIYVPPANDARWDTRLAMTEPTGDEDPRGVLPLAAKLHQPDVMTPILGWLAAAPFRSLIREFPTLAVMGSAGSGKTTMVSTLLALFGWSNGTPISVSNSTWHAVWSSASSTNGIPVWFDEYRAGTRADGISALEQAVRDAWNGAATLRGGAGDNKSALVSMTATAPLLVSGESAFQEASHAERTVYVPLRRLGRSPEALSAVRSWGSEGLGLQYLAFVLRSLNEGLPPLPELTDRPAQALACARWGYQVLLDFLGDWAADMPAWDDTLVLSSQSELMKSNPYLEVLREALTAYDGGVPLVQSVGADLHIRYGLIPTFAKARTSITLPGGEGALMAWIREQWPQTVLRVDRTHGRLAVVPGGANLLNI